MNSVITVTFSGSFDIELDNLTLCDIDGNELEFEDWIDKSTFIKNPTNNWILESFVNCLTDCEDYELETIK